MVAAALLLAMAAGASGTMDFPTDTEPVIRKAHLPPITTVVVESTGATSPAAREPDEQCPSFKLSNKEIRQFLGKAGEVAEHDYLHMLDWSPCYNSGKVTFKNGTTGNWEIHQYRGGTLKLDSGKTVYLYCPKCKAKTFPAAEK